MVNNIVRWPFSIFCPQHIADWWNGISVCCLKWVHLITNFERVLWRWLKAECVSAEVSTKFREIFPMYGELGREAFQISTGMKKVEKSYPPKKGKVIFQGKGLLRILWCLLKFRRHLYVTDRRAGLSHHGSRTKKERGRRDSIQIPGYTGTATAAAGPVSGIRFMGLNATERFKQNYNLNMLSYSAKCSLNKICRW